MSARQQLLQLQQVARSLHGRYRQLESHGQQALAQIDAEHAAATAELCAAYLRSLDAAELARAAQLTGFRGFERRDPRKALEHERHVLEQGIAQIRADARYQTREQRVGAAGELTVLLDTARRELAPHQEACDRFERLETFLELITTKYDTPEFDVGWWRPDYWRLWSAGDRICRELGMNDFGDDVLPAYRRVADPRDYWRGEATRLEAEIDAIHELVRRHDAAVARLAVLDAIYLEQARGYLGEHVAAADLGLLHQWGSTEPAIVDGLRKLAGIRAKREYVREIVHDGVAPALVNLEARDAKYDRKLGKLSRGKHLSPAEYEDSLLRKANSLDAQAAKTEKRIDQLVRARNYDTFDMHHDHHVWWVHFTGSPPPPLAPHTRAWYQQHSEWSAWSPEPTPEPDADLGRAFVAGRDSEQGGYLS